MHPRAQELITHLNLRPHPEGGHYREIHRSGLGVDPADGRPRRAALTVIHFLLTRGESSRWHAVTSDEQWQFVEGDDLLLLVCDPEFRAVSELTVSRDPVERSTHVVPAGYWQAARSSGDYSLVTCTVGPGFDFADFRMLADAPHEAEAFGKAQAAWKRFV
jgi:predicted cupin superfamily sugar epimerase